MAITTAICSSFRQQILVGTHNLTASTGDVFKLALYVSAATLGAATTAYSATNEASGTGYTAGGAALTNITPALSGTVACVDFQDLTISAVTTTARGCLIYNSSKSNAAMSVHDFGADKTSSGGDFIITFPTPDASNAIVRI